MDLKREFGNEERFFTLFGLMSGLLAFLGIVEILILKDNFAGLIALSNAYVSLLFGFIWAKTTTDKYQIIIELLTFKRDYFLERNYDLKRQIKVRGGKDTKM